MKERLPSFTADLHIHTSLSPCADEQMVPELVFAQALKAGVDILAITDHNSTRNLPAFLRNCPKELWVIPGMEVQTREEIHMVCLFPDLATAMEWGRTVYALLPPIDNGKTYFGKQIILDVNGKPCGEEERLLLNSITLSLEETIDKVRALGGLIYPAHVDRPAFSLSSQLGFIPTNLKLTILEISPRSSIEIIQQQYPNHTLIRASDAHYLGQIGKKTSTLNMAGRNWRELLLALSRQAQRDVTLH